MEIGDTFGFLLGTWDVSRVLTDHRCRTQGSFEGTAEVTEPRNPHGPGAATGRIYFNADRSVEAAAKGRRCSSCAWRHRPRTSAA